MLEVCFEPCHAYPPVPTGGIAGGRGFAAVVILGARLPGSELRREARVIQPGVDDTARHNELVMVIPVVQR